MTGQPNMEYRDVTGGNPMESKAPYDQQSDMTLGRSFYMPAVRPLSFMNDSDIPISSSIDLLNTQRPLIGQQAIDVLVNGFERAEERKSGLISTLGLFQGLTRAGLGAMAGYNIANLLGTIFSLPPSTKQKMATFGAIGGAIDNSGLLPYIINAGEKAVYSLSRPMDKYSEDMAMEMKIEDALQVPEVRARLMTKIKRNIMPNMDLENRTKNDLILAGPSTI